MKIWETLVGVRDDLPTLRRKWWHRLAIIFLFVTAVIVFFVSGALFNLEPITPTPRNVFSLSIVTFAKGRPDHVSRLTELNTLPGSSIGTLANDELSPLELAPAPENIRCQAPARLKASQTLVEKDSNSGVDVAFTAIPDRVGQPDGELRHCAATPAYASLVADHVVSYRLNTAYRRWHSGSAAAKALVIAAAWFILALNVYHRGIIGIYVARRKRIRSHRQSR
jgi:hypothetical protein